MSSLLPRDLRSFAEYRYVTSWFARARPPGAGDLVDIRDPAASPDGSMLAFTGWVSGDEHGPVPQVAVANAGSGEMRLLGPAGAPRRHRPVWSPDGTQLACLERDSTGLDRAVLLTVGPGLSLARAPALVSPRDVRGSVEGCWWSPDGTRLLMLAAEPGAEVSDVFGSGRIPGPDEPMPSWMPAVPLDGHAGWRRLWVWDRASGAVRAVQVPLNVWEADWAGPDSLCVVASSGPAEDQWYDARWARIELQDGGCEILDGGADQLAMPRANPAGTLLSVISGRASDRGLVAGALQVAGPLPGSPRLVDTLGADVTGHAWRDDNRLTFTGVRGDESVLGEFDARTGSSVQLWASPESIGPGDLLPAASPAGRLDAVAVVLESHARPPAIGVVTGGAFRPVTRVAHTGTGFVSQWCGSPRWLEWASPDGTTICGLLYQPPAGGCRGLVVLIHGGPIWCWRDIWTERIPLIPLLLSRRFSVLLPNGRGSQGRGAQFTAAIVGEVGGRDVADVLAGVDTVLATGLAGRSQVAVIGSSYGGFLAAYLATIPGRFATAVAISPATEWVSQHYTTNIPASDLRFLSGLPLDPESHYATRNALRAVSARTAPVLLTAGALDLATPPSQALMFYRALAEHGVDADLAIYSEEGHDVHQQAAVVDQYTRILIWLERYLREPAGAEGRR